MFRSECSLQEMVKRTSITIRQFWQARERQGIFGSHNSDNYDHGSRLPFRNVHLQSTHNIKLGAVYMDVVHTLRSHVIDIKQVFTQRDLQS